MPKKSRSFALKGKPNSGITLLVAILVIASLSLLFLCGTNCCISCGLTPTGAAAGSTQGGGVYEYFYNGTSSEGLPGTGTGILSGGDGSPGNPYQISTCAELSAIRNNLNANYIITNNIVCTGLWSPIGENPLGTSNDWFKGVLDGQYYTVSGIQISSSEYPGSRGTAMIRYIGPTGVVKNLNIRGTSVSGVDIIAGLAARNDGKIERVSVWFNTISVGGTGGGITASNVGIINQSFANITSISGNHKGLLTGGNNGLVIDSYAMGSAGGSGCTSGLTQSSDGTIRNSYSIGTANGAGDCGRGGLSGYLAGSALIINSFFAGTVSGGAPLGAVVGVNAATNPQTILSNVYFNNVGTPSNCVGSNPPTSGCTAISNNAAYFYSSSNAPMSSWDFNKVWRQRQNNYPVLFWQLPGPVVDRGECYTTSWQACSSVSYGNTITKLRLNCSDPTGGRVTNATFKLENVPDSNVFFYANNATSRDGTWWVYDNPDVLVQDSGTWRFTAGCVNNVLKEGTKAVDWNVANQVPSINQVQCNDGSSWVACSSIPYGSAITQVRANCTDDFAIPNVGFKLKNMPDNRVFFDSNSTSHSGNLWTYNNNDITISDSGVWNLTVTCYDNELHNPPNGIASTVWTVPWGVLSTSLISPTTNRNAGQGLPFTFHSRVTCLGGECGDVSAILDPPNCNGGCVELDVNGKTIRMDSTSRRDTGDILQARNNCLAVGGDLTNFDESLKWVYWHAESSFDIVYYSYDSHSNTCDNYIAYGYSSCCGKVGNYFGYHDLYGCSCHYCYGSSGWYDPTSSFGYVCAFRNMAPEIHLVNTSASPVGLNYEITCQADVTEPDAEQIIWVNFTVRSSSGNAIISNVNGSRSGDIWTSPSFITNRSGGWNCSVVAADINSNKAYSWAGFQPGYKGIVPMGSGTPFYTTSQNPTSCLGMGGGDVCDSSWEVYATGPRRTTWEFFTIYNSTTNPTYVLANTTRTVNITIIPVGAFASTPQCHNGAQWVECSEIAYNETVYKLRANCTIVNSADYLTRAAFNVTNVEDSEVKLLVNATSVNGDWWIYDNANLWLRDSGGWEFTATCFDNSSRQDSSKVSWSLPWGHFSPSLITQDMNVSQNHMFPFKSRVACQDGECGNVNITLDPTEDGTGSPITIAGEGVTLSRIYETQLMDYGGSCNNCFGHPPSISSLGTLAAPSAFTAISASDNSWFVTYLTSPSGFDDTDTQSYVYTAQSNDVSGITVNWEGYAPSGRNWCGQWYFTTKMYAYNWYTGAWVKLMEDCNRGSDYSYTASICNSGCTVNEDPSHYIAGNNEITITVQGDNYQHDSPSCPNLYTWNGTGFEYITDLVSPGGFGWDDATGTNTYRRPYSLDYAKISGDQLKAVEGKYTISVKEDQNELTYLDKVKLIAVDHEPGVDYYSNMLSTNVYDRPFEMHTSTDLITPKSAYHEDYGEDLTLSNKKDVLDKVSKLDGNYANATDFHWDVMTLDFGDLSGAEQIKLIFKSYVQWASDQEFADQYNYIYSHPNATWNKIAYVPYLEVVAQNGSWVRVPMQEPYGLPNAQPRLNALDITDYFQSNNYTIRIYDWFKVHYDFIAVDTTPDVEPYKVTAIEPTYADLHYRGSSIYAPQNDMGLSKPVYDLTYAPDFFASYVGNFTRYGDVLPLVDEADDEFVIMHYNDEVLLEFPEQPVPEGMERDYYLLTDGYFKQDFVKYLLGQNVSQVTPLPFHGMTTYPYPESESYPYDAEHLQYLQEYNTRYLGPTPQRHHSLYTDYMDLTAPSANLPPTIHLLETSVTPVGLRQNITCRTRVTDPEASPIAYVRFTVRDAGSNAIINNVVGAQNGDIWTSPYFVTNVAGTWNCSIVASDGARTSSGSIAFSVGGKGAIPMGSGTPFYTTSPNPASCSGLKGDDVCVTGWTVNATGSIGSTWEFFATYNATAYPGYILSNTTDSAYITILLRGDEAPNATKVTLNSTQLTNWTNDTLTCWANITDEEPVIIAYYYWYKNSALNRSGSVTVPTNLSLISNVTGRLVRGDVWRCGVMADDGVWNSTQSNSTNLTIINSPPTVTLNSPRDGQVLYRTTAPVLNITVSDADGDAMNVTFYNASGSAICINSSSFSSGSTVACRWANRTANVTYSWYANVTDGYGTMRSSTWNFTSNDEPFVMNMRVESKGPSWIEFAWENEPDMAWISLYVGNEIVHVMTLSSTSNHWNATGLYRDTEYDFFWQVGDSLLAVSDRRGFPVKTAGWVHPEADIGYKRLVTVDDVHTDMPYAALNLTLTEENFKYCAQYCDYPGYEVWEPGFKHLNWTDGHNIRFYDYGEITPLKYTISSWRVPGDGGTSIQIPPDETSFTGDWTNPELTHDSNDGTYGYTPSTGAYYYNYTLPEYAKPESQFDKYDGSHLWYYTPPPSDCWPGGGDTQKLRFKTEGDYDYNDTGRYDTYCWNYTSGDWGYMTTSLARFFFETRMKWIYDCEAEITVMPLHFDYDSQANQPGLDGDYVNKFWFYYGDAVGNEDNSSALEDLDARAYHTEYTLGDEISYALPPPEISNIVESGQTATGITISWDVDRAVDNRLQIADNQWMVNALWAWQIVNVTDHFNHLYGSSNHSDILTVYGGDYIGTVSVTCSNASYNSQYVLNTSTGDAPVEIRFLNVNSTEYLNWTVTVTENKSWDRATGSPSFTVSGLTPNREYYYRVHAYGGGGFGESTEDGDFILGTPGMRPQLEITSYTEDRPASQVTICGRLTDDLGEGPLPAYFDYWVQNGSTSNVTTSQLLSESETMCKTISVAYGNTYYYRMLAQGSELGWSEPYINDFMAIQDFFAGNPIEDDNDDRDRQYCPRNLFSNYDLNGSDATWTWLEPCYNQTGYWEGSQQEEDWMWVETNINVLGADSLPLTLNLWDGSSWADHAMAKDPDSDMVYALLDDLGADWYTFYITNDDGDVILNWTKPGMTHLAQHGREDVSKYVKFAGTRSPVYYDLMYMHPASVYNTSAYRWCMAQGEEPISNPMGNLYDCMSVQYWGGDRESGMEAGLTGSEYDRGQLMRGGVTNGEPYDTGMLRDWLNTTRPMTSGDGGWERHCYAFTVYFWDSDKLPSNDITSYYYRYWHTSQRMSTYLGYAQDAEYDYNTFFKWQYDRVSASRDWKEQVQASLNGTTGWPSGRNGAGLPHIAANATPDTFPAYPYNQSLFAGWAYFDSSPVQLDGLHSDEVYDFGFMTDGQWTNQQLGLHQQGFVVFNLPDNDTLRGMDSDSDGLSDYDELFTHYTNPKYNDTDEGGRADGEEVAMGKNPNIYTDDNGAPSITILRPLAGAYVTGSYNITWTSSDPESDPLTVEITLANATGGSRHHIANVTGASWHSWNSAAYSDGAYQIVLRACDHYSCSPEASGGEFTIDNTNPTITWGSMTPPDGARMSRSYIASNVTWTEQNLKNITWSFNGVPISFTTPQYMYNKTGLTDGTYTYLVRICDKAIHCASTPARTAILDTTPPSLTWTWGANTRSRASYVNVTLSSNEDLSLCTLNINGTSYPMAKNTSRTFYYYWSVPSDNKYSVGATCKDLSNNTGNVMFAWYILDTTPPRITWDWADKNSTITVNSTHICVTLDETGTCTLRWNLAAYPNATQGTNICWAKTVADGYYTAYAFCQDTLGNSAVSSQTWLRVDTVSPTITLNSAQNAILTTTSHTFDVSTNENANCSVYYDSSYHAMTGAALAHTYAATLSETNHTGIYYLCQDVYGNPRTSGTYWLYVNVSIYMSVDKSVSVATAYTGSILNWTIAVRNNGLTYLNVTLNDTNGQDYTITNLGPGESRTLSYTTIAGCTSVNNTVNATAENAYRTYTTSDWASVLVASCGDGACDCGENSGSCSQDCPRATCSKAWSCGSWGSCSNGQQARACSCGCPDDADCTGDNTESRSCACSSASDCAQVACKTASCTDNNCQYSNAAGSCNDNNACTTGDTCSAGSCSGTLITCSDSNACTTDTCDANLGCVFTPNTLTCDDSDACTTGDTCSAGVCSGTPIDCDDLIECTDDSCLDGSCQNIPASCGCVTAGDCPAETCKTASCVSGVCAYAGAEGACDDGNICTGNDTCFTGSCSGTPVSCDDSNTCTDDSCDAELGCIFTPNTASCDDGDSCTERDYCMNSACTPGPNTCPCSKDSDCDDGNPCTEESCVSAVCEYTDKEGSCDDGKDCTKNDYCDSGRCVGGEGTCKGGAEQCTSSWSCSAWSSCSDSKQTRACECRCPGDSCSGDHETEKSCGGVTTTTQIIQISATEGLQVGDVLQLTLTDENGNPISGRIILIRPDGTEVILDGDSYVVDQAGVWTVRVEKEGYAPAESETNVKAKQAADLGTQIGQAVQSVVDFITKEPVRAALLMTTIVLVVGGLFFLKFRKKSSVEKL